MNETPPPSPTTQKKTTAEAYCTKEALSLCKYVKTAITYYPPSFNKRLDKFN